MRRFSTGILLVLLSTTLLSSGSLASEAAGENLPDNIAFELMNPIGRLSAVDNRLFYRSFQGDLPGAGDQTTQGYVFEPVIPFGLPNGRRLALRFSLPVTFSTPAYVLGNREYAAWLIRQRADTLTDDGYFIEGHGHLDDVTYDLAYGDTEDDGLFWMFGLAGALPTSQDGSIERDQYLLGPQAAIGKTYDWGIIGAWGKHLVDVASSKRTEDQNPIDWNTSETRIRLIFAYGLGNGWQIVSNPEFVYDWEGVSGNKMLLPLGGGVAKTFSIGGVPVRASLEGFYYAESPEAFGPEWQVNFNLTPVISAWSLD
jgi:hypothetical protein